MFYELSEGLTPILIDMYVDCSSSKVHHLNF